MVDLDTILTPWQRAGMSLGLERIQALMTILGNPQNKIPVVHVAGSNGKGSVCAYLSTVLTTAGYRVGRYTSPHLVDWNERICINNQPITTDRLTTILQHVQAQSPEPAWGSRTRRRRERVRRICKRERRRGRRTRG